MVINSDHILIDSIKSAWLLLIVIWYQIGTETILTTMWIYLLVAINNYQVF